MGNFQPLTTLTNKRVRNHKRRSILKGSIGADGDNHPNDLRMIARAFSEAGLLTTDASQEDIKHAIRRALHHIQRIDKPSAPSKNTSATLVPSSDMELAMRRALAEFRFPTAHRSVALLAAPKGARAIVETGASLAKQRLQEDTQTHETPTAFQRAKLPSLPPETYQSNRRLAETIAQSNIEGLDSLIAESLRQSGKPGFVEVRDFFNILNSLKPDRAKSLGEKVKRHLRGKSRRRFIKLIQNVPPNEDDFVDGPS